MPYVNAAFPSGKHPGDLPLVQEVVSVADATSASVYLVGGFLRDVLSSSSRPQPDGKEVFKDLDFAVASMTAVDFARHCAEKTGGHFVLLDRDFDTARVVLEDARIIDFAGCIGGTIESDIRRRDFTINALVWDPKKPDCVLDEFGGLEDLAARLIKAISEETFIDDPLRLLRAYRFSSLLSASIDDTTFEWINAHSDKISTVAQERINVELFIMLNCPKAASQLESMGRNGMLEAIFPELVPTRKVTANAFHHLGLFEHSLEAVNQLEQNLGRMPDWTHSSFANCFPNGITRLAATKLAALLHDIGKPGTWEITEEGRHTFYGHDNLGAEMADETALRMKWSKPLSRFISKLIKWHLRPGQLFHQGAPTDKALHRFFRKVDDDLPELILLAFGDLGATRGDGLSEESRTNLDKCFFDLLSGYQIFQEEAESNPPLLNGLDVMNLLSIKPGPLVGEILEFLLEAQMLKQVSDRPSAELFVQNYYEKKYSS